MLKQVNTASLQDRHMSNEELRGKIWSLFNLEPDDDGIMPREFPAQRIVRHHNVDMTFAQANMKLRCRRRFNHVGIYSRSSTVKIRISGEEWLVERTNRCASGRRSVRLLA